MQLRKNKFKGFTLIELMIATTLASLMSIGVLSVYVNQSGNISSESQRDATKREAHRAFNTISRLLRQAQRDSIQIAYNGANQGAVSTQPDIVGTSLQIDFTLPENTDIWPNVNSSVIDNNAVRLSWAAGNGTSPFQIQIANTTSMGGLAAAPLETMAGSNNNSMPHIINVVFWPLNTQRTIQAAVTDNANSGYLLQITARTGAPDLTYINPKYSTGTFKNYRTYTVSGVVAPRNS